MFGQETMINELKVASSSDIKEKVGILAYLATVVKVDCWLYLVPG